MPERTKIQNIDASEDFFKELTNCIIDRFSKNNKLKDTIIILPTKNACDSLRKYFIELGYYDIAIYSVNDLKSQNNKTFSKLTSVRESEEYSGHKTRAHTKVHEDSSIELTYTVSTEVEFQKNSIVLSRIALVAKVSQFILTMNLANFKDLSSVIPLAEYFANFIHNVELHEISFDRIIQIIDEDFSIHQQELFLILKELIKLWKDGGYITKAGANNLSIKNLAQNLQGKILIVAGISYNIPSILELMTKAQLLVFYGADKNLTVQDWNNVDITHGQYNFKQILAKLGISPQDIKNSSLTNIENDFISNSLKPSKSCAKWYDLNKTSTPSLSYLPCLNLHHEAKSIVNLLQNTTYKKAMVITPDDDLMVKIILNLQAANLQTNIVRDYPLKQSSSGILMQLCLNLISDKFSLLTSLALLKHPVINIDQSVVSDIETIIRDKNFYGSSIFDVNIEDEKFHSIITACTNIREIFLLKFSSFKQIFHEHINFVQNISHSSLWAGADGEELKIYLDQILESAEMFGHIAVKNYPQAFNHFIKSAYYRPEISDHKITLLKPIDAKLHSADLVILAGLNEGIWPNRNSIDPCLNHNLIKKIGLPQPEHSIGEEAYDFQCFAQNKQVVLTRSEKISGVPMAPSRWLSRILTFSGGLPTPLSLLEAECENEANDFIRGGAEPIPPLQYRPFHLSVTQIDKLVFNPYHIYVDLILKLKPLLPLEKKLSALDFGIFIHKALEIYHYKHKEPSLEILLNSGKQALTELNLNKTKLQVIYWQRFIRIAKWFVANENVSNKSYLEAYGIIPIGSNFKITAKADRIEISPDNSLHVIDYKTGRLATNKAINSGHNLQLLLEGMIGKNGGFCFQKTAQQVESLSYIQLSGGENLAEILKISSELIEKTEKYIHDLIAQYQNPSTPYYYSKKKKIGYCKYEHLARVRPL